MVGMFPLLRVEGPTLKNRPTTFLFGTPSQEPGAALEMPGGDLGWGILSRIIQLQSRSSWFLNLG